MAKTKPHITNEQKFQLYRYLYENADNLTNLPFDQIRSKVATDLKFVPSDSTIRRTIQQGHIPIKIGKSYGGRSGGSPLTAIYAKVAVMYKAIEELHERCGKDMPTYLIREFETLDIDKYTNQEQHG